MNKPAESYIKRGLEIESLQVRVCSDLKRDAQIASEKLNTSLNRLVEAALKWYLEQLKKEGEL